LDKGLIILGRGPSGKQCPFDREVWSTVSVLEEDSFRDKPFSKVFIFDRWHGDVPHEGWPDNWKPMRVAREKKIPIIGAWSFEFITECYPVPAVKKRFGSLFLNNSVSFMLALALYEGYKDINLWGVLSNNPEDYDEGGKYEEYRYARKYTTYWLGVATGMNVKWELCPDGRLW